MAKRKYDIKYKFADYLKEKVSLRISIRYADPLKKYMYHVINAILHGYVIRFGNIIKFKFIKIPVGERPVNSRTYYFKSKLTSDWLFYIDIECNIMSKYDVKYFPSILIRKQVQGFIDSEKVYELIR